MHGGNFSRCLQILDKCNFLPKLHALDNKCSKAVQSYTESNNTNIQLVEPHNHRVNAAETAIKATKYHILAGLQTVDKDCPLQLWSKFTEQMQDTLNLLRTTRQDPTKSAYKFLQGKFDYNKTPMAILGTRAVAFTDPDKRGAWEAHGVDAYVVGRCPLHYRLIKFFNTKTRAFLKAGTYRLYPNQSRVPTISKADRTIMAAGDILRQLQGLISKDTEEKLKHNKAIVQLTEILNQPPNKAAGPARVAGGATPRVDAPASSTTDPTNPATIRATRPVHGRRTRANPNPITGEPLPTIWEDSQQTQPAPAPTNGPHSPWPTTKQNGQLIGGKKNNVRHASLKRVQKLINEQLVEDGRNLAQREQSDRAKRAQRRAEQRLRQLQ